MKACKSHDLRLVNAFLYMIPNASAMKEKKNKLTSSKLKIFVLQSTLSRKWKDNPKNRRKYLQIIYLLRV